MITSFLPNKPSALSFLKIYEHINLFPRNYFYFYVWFNWVRSRALHKMMIKLRKMQVAPSFPYNSCTILENFTQPPANYLCYDSRGEGQQEVEHDTMETWSVWWMTPQSALTHNL